MRFRALVLFVVVFSSSLLFGEENVTLRNGSSVILRDDGTWEVVSSAAETNPGFRDFPWGVGEAVVLGAEETTPTYDQDGILEYSSSVVGFETLVVFYFIEDRLVRGRYYVQPTHSNKNDFISDFDRLKSVLSQKYGKSIESLQTWKDPNSIWKRDPSYWGKKIADGELSYSERWETPTSRIDMRLTGMDYEISFIVEYTSKELEFLIDKRRSEKL